MPKDLVVILTALNLEYEAVRRELASPQVHRHERGTRFEVGTVPGTSCRVALGLTNKGIIPLQCSRSAQYRSSRLWLCCSLASPVPCGTPPGWATW